MPKKLRAFVSATLIKILLLSAFVSFKPVTAQACPVAPPPKSLLSLYIKSDLIFTGEIKSETEKPIPGEPDMSNYVEKTRHLRVFSVLKGKIGSDFSFKQREYKPSEESENPETEAEIEEAEMYYDSYGYNIISEMKQDEKYLFFFVKDSDTQEFELTDSRSAVRKFDEHGFAVHEKRIKELKGILNAKKDQVPKLTEWLVRCVEEPSTRWDGIFELVNAFENIESDKNAEYEEDLSLVIKKGFNTSPAIIAKSLSESQKNRISNLFYSLPQSEIFKSADENLYYSLPSLIKNWDNFRLITYSFGVFQSADKTNVENNLTALRFLSYFIEDENLSDITYRYETDEPEELDAEDSEKAVETIENKTVSNVSETDNLTERKVEDSNKFSEKKEVEKKVLREKIKAKILQEFFDRYQYMLARNFVAEDLKSEETVNGEIEQ